MNVYDIGDLVVLELPLTVDGVATDPTALTIRITPPSGAVITKQWPSPLEITRVGVGSFRYDYSPLVPGLYAYEWSATGNATADERGYFEVRPAYVVNTPSRLCTVGDLQDFLQLTISNVPAALRAIEGATVAIQDWTYQQLIYVANDVVTLDPVGGTSMLLPEVPVVAVGSVVESGVALVMTADYTWTADGILRRRWPQQSSRVWPLTGVREFPNEPQSLVVTYSHGYQTIPGILREVCIRSASRAYQAGLRSAAQRGMIGVQAEQLPDYQVVYQRDTATGDSSSLGVSASPFLLPSEKEALSSFRMKP